jgi:hypothetical protein
MTSPFRLARGNINLLLLLAAACSSLFTVSNAFSVAGARPTATSPRALSCFVTPPLHRNHRFVTVSRVVSTAAAVLPTSRLFSSQDDDTDASASASRPKRRVRRRKESDAGDASSDDTNADSSSSTSAEETAAPPEAAAPAADLKPREAAKPMQVRDIRDLVPGGRASSTETPSGSSVPEQSDTSASSPSSTQAAPTKSMYVSAGAGSNSENTGNLDDSLKMLLADARKMQVDKDTERKEAIESGTADETDDRSLQKKVRSAIGTIIAADFFVVCAFLIWFLVGIAARSVADNDTIQIAFNNNFQLLVQPAIGILMVGSVAGAIFPEKEEEF